MWVLFFVGFSDMGFWFFLGVVVKLSMHNKVKNRGLAFVTMGSPEEALTALNNLDSYVSILGFFFLIINILFLCL